jgi:F-type H+-transporting ATPase subunit alpha
MKKIAGTLKLDQAQYRELEAFSKFGSDLDAATKAVLDKGARNVEVLKQKQFSPMPVEKQIAIIYLGTQGLLQNIPVNKVKEFEQDYLQTLEISQKNVLEDLRKGNLSDESLATLRKVAKEVESGYTTKATTLAGVKTEVKS